MQLEPTVQAALLDHLPKEIGAFFAYRDLASQVRALGYTHSAAYFDAAALEEVSHHAQILAYLRDRMDAAAPTDIPTLTMPILTTLPAAYAAAYDLECQVHQSLDRVVSVARGAADEATARLLGVLIDEQVQAEAELADIGRQIRDLSPDGLVLWDLEQGE